MSLTVPPVTSVSTNQTLIGNGSPETPLAVDPSVLVVKQASLILTDAQMRALVSGETVVVVPGVSGKLYQFVRGTIIFDFTGGAYSLVGGTQGILLKFSTGGANSTSSDDQAWVFEDSSQRWLGEFLPNINSVADGISTTSGGMDLSDAVPLGLHFQAGFTGEVFLSGGNVANTMRIMVHYVELDI